MSIDVSGLTYSGLISSMHLYSFCPGGEIWWKKKYVLISKVAILTDFLQVTYNASQPLSSWTCLLQTLQLRCNVCNTNNFLNMYYNFLAIIWNWIQYKICVWKFWWTRLIPVFGTLLVFHFEIGYWSPGVGSCRPFSDG